MTRARLALAVSAAGIGLALGAIGLPGPAVAAGPPFQERIVEPYAFTAEDVCGVEGLDVAVEGTFMSRLHIRTGPDGLEYFLENITVHETHTFNDVTTTYVERSLVRDHKLSFDPETGLLDIIVLATGNAVLYGPDGEAIARDPGQSRFHIVFDTVNEVEVLFERVFGSTGRSDDFCAAELPLFTG